MIHADFTEYKETSGQDPFTLQNSKMLKVFLKYGPIKARVGSMVAYQGNASFSHAGSGGSINPRTTTRRSAPPPSRPVRRPPPR